MRSLFRTTRKPSQRLIVFARFPERGKVKQRLAREIGEERALEVYRAMLRDLWPSIGKSNDEFEIEVAWTGGEHAAGSEIAAAFPGYSLAMQSGPTLGERLILAFSERFFFHRAETIVAIGADEPRLPRELIESAFQLLESCDWVIGPAADGGYYLVGARAETFSPSAFEGIHWGEPTVFHETLARLRRRNVTVAILPLRRDIDRPDDLRDYVEREPDSEVATLVKKWRS